jgi:hypothetical protein
MRELVLSTPMLRCIAGVTTGMVKQETLNHKLRSIFQSSSITAITTPHSMIVTQMLMGF